MDELIGPEAAARARPHWARARAGELVSYENQIRNRAGEVVYVLTTVVPQRSADGTISSFVLTASDITALKHAERALRESNESLEKRVQERTAELQAANKELEAFSYSVSHDLRAPLRAIDGFSRIVLESFGSELPAEAQEYLRDIRANTQQMGRLVDDLLAFSRINRQPIRRQSIETRDLVSSTLRYLQLAYAGRHIELRIGDLPSCQADPSLLTQVWSNLLDNAMKYTGKRDPAIIEVGAQPDSHPVVYYVRDNGVGFDMRYAHKLFGVFQRLHRAEDYEGTGVGLATVQRIVQRHGGRIWAEAKPDQGATFLFTLPELQSPPHDE
jgi:light-regulated signal transduction histidine kinase (bacteriophytochrome)